MESLQRRPDYELQAPDFVEAVARFRSAVKEFTAAVNRLDSSIAAAIQIYGEHDGTRSIQTDPEIPAGYHPPA
jgi:hypothetical protein